MSADDIYSPVQCTSFDNSASTENNITDSSNADVSILSPKAFLEPQNKSSNTTRPAERNCPESFSEMKYKVYMKSNDFSSSKGSSSCQYEDVFRHSSDASDLLHEKIGRKEMSLQNMDTRSKAPSKNDKVNNSMPSKKTCLKNLKGSDITSTPVANPRKEKSKERNLRSKKGSTISISKGCAKVADCNCVQENKKSMTTSSSQTDISLEELLSPDKSINKSVSEIIDKDDCVSSIPVNHYQVSVQKIIHDAISSECDKIRQLLYAQRMSSFKHINEQLVQQEFQIMMIQERLLKVVGELAQVQVLDKNKQ